VRGSECALWAAAMLSWQESAAGGVTAAGMLLCRDRCMWRSHHMHFSIENTKLVSTAPIARLAE
jgi:hypothetical protein